MANVETLYKCFGVLADAKDKAKDHVEEYDLILKAVSGNSATKRLAAQFIARFFKHFPAKVDDAINAVMDLCEDEDISIRRAAVKEIPTLCKASEQNLPRLADVLVQLMQCEDTAELHAVQAALMSLFRINCKGTLTGLFLQINEGDEVIRERAIKFLCTKFSKLSEEILTKEIEDFVFAECKKIMEDVTGEEFQKLIKFLSSLQHLKSIQGRGQILKMIADQMQQSTFDASDVDSVKRVLQCLGMGQALVSRNVHSGSLINYVCKNVLPVLSDITTEDSLLEMIKILAEISIDGGPNTQDTIEPLFNALLAYMPLPPDIENELKIEPKFEFSHVECLIFAFYQISSKHPEFLTKEEAQDRLKDFRKRLTYFARGLNIYIRQLKPALNNQNKDKVKAIALKTCNNINVLIKDLFHNPPSYKSTIHLSWKPVPAAPVAQKRSSTGETNGDARAKANRSDQQMYKAPSGKYSASISPGTGYSRGRGSRGRGGWRGNQGNRYRY